MDKILQHLGWLKAYKWDVYHQLVQDFATINWFPSS
jgi:hypothetical protein